MSLNVNSRRLTNAVPILLAIIYCYFCDCCETGVVYYYYYYYCYKNKLLLAAGYETEMITAVSA